jgi:uncharacterized membrane protein required for colicin V production
LKIKRLKFSLQRMFLADAANSVGATILLLAVVVLLVSALHGWVNGLPRMVLELASLILASTLAWTFHSAIGAVLKTFLPLPSLALEVVGGLCIVFTVVVVFKLIGFLFVKKTKHYSTGFKAVFGISGAALGFLEGLFFVTLFCLMIQAIGTVSEIQLAAQMKETPQVKPHPLVSTIVNIKKSIDGSFVGPILKSIDPVPPSIYVCFRKFDALVRDPAAMDRFLAFPKTRELLAHPKLVAVAQDPQLRQDFYERHLEKVVTSKQVIGALSDPDVQKKLMEFPWKGALDFAVPDSSLPPHE